MTKDFRDTWCAALRSDKYKQGGGTLYSVLEEAYCCLGVLCAIHPKVQFDGYGIAHYFTSDSYAFLPIPLSIDIGLTEAEQQALAKMNDNGASFSEIADWIEQNIEVTE